MKPGKYPLWEQISAVVITDQFSVNYMNVLKSYDIKAKLINKMSKENRIDLSTDDIKKS